jgi:DNA repair exonuclease SbcCD ATPase subunit
MLTERPSSRKAPVMEAENVPPPPPRGRAVKPRDRPTAVKEYPHVVAQTPAGQPSPTIWIPEDATPCGDGHRSVEAQYQDALRALNADRETLRREVERVIAAEASRESEHASLRARCAELEALQREDRTEVSDSQQPATLAMVRKLRKELSEARAAATEAARAQVERLSSSDAPDETELSMIRVEIDRTRAEMAAALRDVSDAAKDRDEAMTEVQTELGVLQAERMRLRAQAESAFKKLAAVGGAAGGAGEVVSERSSGEAASLRARVRDLETHLVAKTADATRFEALKGELTAMTKSFADDAKLSAEVEAAMQREIRCVRGELRSRTRELKETRIQLKETRTRLEEERTRRADAESNAERERRRAEDIETAGHLQRRPILTPAVDDAEVANLRSDLRDEISLVRRALEDMDAMTRQLAEGTSSMDGLRNELDSTKNEVLGAFRADADTLRSELSRLDEEARRDVVRMGRELATAHDRARGVETESVEARLRLAEMNEECVRVASASSALVKEKDQLVREINARAQELADERAEGEHRRRQHNAEKDELQRQLYALMRDREEALAKFRVEKNRWNDELREARIGATSATTSGLSAGGGIESLQVASLRRELADSRSGGVRGFSGASVPASSAGSFGAREHSREFSSGQRNFDEGSAFDEFASSHAASPVPGPPPPPPPPPGASSRPSSAAGSVRSYESRMSRESRGRPGRSGISGTVPPPSEGARESANDLVNALVASRSRPSSSTSY